MKCYFIIFTFFLLHVRSNGQKRVADTSDFGKASVLASGNMTNDGRYFYYILEGDEGRNVRLVVKSNDSEWKREIPGVNYAIFTPDSKKIIYALGNERDSLCIKTLGTDECNYIDHLNTHEVLIGTSGVWIAYHKKGMDLIVRNLNDGREKTYPFVDNFSFCDKSNVLINIVKRDGDEGGMRELEWVDLATGKRNVFWEGAEAANISFDNEGRKIAFIARSKGDTTISLWYYNSATAKAVKEMDGFAHGGDDSLLLSKERLEFDRMGKKIFFQLTERNFSVSAVTGPKVDIWNYRDKVLQDDQLEYDLSPKKFLAVVDVESGKWFRVQGNDDEMNIRGQGDVYGKYSIVIHQRERNEFWWNKSAQGALYLVSNVDGSRKLLKSPLTFINTTFGLQLSPQERYVVYYDPNEDAYFSYNIATSIARPITSSTGPSWLDRSYGSTRGASSYQFPVGIGGWIQNDTAVLVYDDYDIWSLDPGGKRAPRNITNGYGRRHHIKFRFLKQGDSRKNLYTGQDMLLSAFDTVSKMQGFFSMKLGLIKDPVFLSMEPFKYDENVVQSKDGRGWMLKRESPTNAPNWYFTRDFKSFSPVSDYQPQKDINWLTAELVRWKMPNGDSAAGILYKPENFDSRIKYPVIFHYYEEQSDNLFQYRFLQPSEGEINITYFVSRGYLVFVPDITYKLRYPGMSVVNSVVSAAQYFMQKHWVDAKRMGLQGHSWGGYETNFLVTHSNLFSAASESAGVSNMVSDYGQMHRQLNYETHQYRMRVSLWDHPDLYVQNSPIFSAEKVTTPYLMMNNKNDGLVSWKQGLEFFMALRRFGKKVWLLQYDNGNHFLSGVDAIDYTIRQWQFFDHYLKGMPAPEWMTKGIPARKKGVDLGYKLDNPGIDP